MYIFKFVNHTKSFYYWLKYLNKREIYYLIHIDKHSDLLSPLGLNNVNCGNFLFYTLLINKNITKFYWIYPSYFNQILKYKLLLKEEIKEIYNNISIYFENAKIFYYQNFILIKTKTVNFYFMTFDKLKVEEKVSYLLDIDCDFFCYLDNKDNIHLNLNEMNSIIDFIERNTKNLKICTICSSIDGGYLPSQLIFIADYLELFLKSFSNSIKIIKTEFWNFYKFMLNLFEIDNPEKKYLYMNSKYKNYNHFLLFRMNYYEVLIFNNKIEKAKQLFNKEKKLIPIKFLRVNGFGFFYGTEGKIEKSIEYLKYTLRYDNNNIYILWRLLLVNWYLKKEDELINFYLILLKLLRINDFSEKIKILEDKLFLKKFLSIISLLNEKNYDDNLIVNFIREAKIFKFNKIFFI